MAKFRFRKSLVPNRFLAIYYHKFHVFIYIVFLLCFFYCYVIITIKDDKDVHMMKFFIKDLKTLGFHFKYKYECITEEKDIHKTFLGTMSISSENFNILTRTELLDNDTSFYEVLGSNKESSSARTAQFEEYLSFCFYCNVNDFQKKVLSKNILWCMRIITVTIDFLFALLIIFVGIPAKFLLLPLICSLFLIAISSIW